MFSTYEKTGATIEMASGLFIWDLTNSILSGMFIITI